MTEECTSQLWYPSNTAIQRHISEDCNFSVGHLLLSGRWWTSHSWRTGLPCTYGVKWRDLLRFVRQSAIPIAVQWLAPSLPLENFTEQVHFIGSATVTRIWIGPTRQEMRGRNKNYPEELFLQSPNPVTRGTSQWGQDDSLSHTFQVISHSTSWH